MNPVVRALEAVGSALRSFYNPPIWTRDPALTHYLGYGPTTSGSNVTEYTALNYSAWWAAVQIIANAVAGLPLFLYRRVSGGEPDAKEKFTSHPLYAILHDAFNPEMTSMVARRTLQAHALSWGNAYAEIERNGSGTPIAIWPLSPDRVRPDRNGQGALIYRVMERDGQEVILPAADTLHIKGQSFDGITGYSVVRMARESIGLGMTTEQFGAQFFGNGAVASIVATHPGVLSEPAHARLKQEILTNTTGGRRHNVLLLEEGIKADRMTIPPEDAQFLATRQFQTLEISRWFNLPPHKLGDLQRATFSNIEQMATEFLQDTLRPWLITWEQELAMKLIRPLEMKQQLIRHNVDGMLRGDYVTRMQGYAIARQWGLMSADEARALEEMNPLPNDQGTIYLTPANMVPADRIHEIVDSQIAIAPTEPTPPVAINPPGGPALTAPSTPGRAAVIAAHRAVLVDALRRMVRKEAQAARRAAKRGVPAFAGWREAFYAKHERDVAQAVRAAVQAHVAQLEAPESAETVSAALARRYVEGSRRELQALSAVPKELENAVDLLVRRWEASRAEQLADGLMTEEVRHALAHAE